MSILLLPGAISLASGGLYMVYNYFTAPTVVESDTPSKFTKDIELNAKAIIKKKAIREQTHKTLLEEIKVYDKSKLLRAVTVVKDVSKIMFIDDLIAKSKSRMSVKISAWNQLAEFVKN